MEYSFDCKGTNIQCKKKIERTKKRTNDHINKSLISSIFQENHGGGETLRQQRNKQQIINNKNSTEDHNTLSGSQISCVNKLN